MRNEIFENDRVYLKRVLMICPFVRPNIGGVEAHIDKLLNYLSNKDVFVYLLTYQPLITKVQGYPIERGPNFVIYRFKWFGRGLFNKIESSFPLTFLYLVPYLLLRSIIFYLKNYKKIDVIHAHGFAAAFIAKVLARLKGCRTVVSTHAIYNLKARKKLSKLVKILLYSFDIILAVGNASKIELINIGLDKNKIKTHDNWININEYNQYDKKIARKFCNLPESGFFVLFVGRLIEKKGINLLVEVAQRVSEDIFFIVIGSDGTELRLVERAANELKNLVHIKLPYSFKAEDNPLIYYYNAADIFIVPSLYSEGFASVILEGISCGTPIIASNMGCIPQIINESVGLLIDPTVENFKNAIEYYYTNKNDLELKAENCRNYAIKNFSDKNAEVILNSYYE